MGLPVNPIRCIELMSDGRSEIDKTTRADGVSQKRVGALYRGRFATTIE